MSTAATGLTIAVLAGQLVASTLAAQEPTSCPSELQGIWSTELPVADLFSVAITIGPLSSTDGEATLRTGSGATERVPVSRSGERLRFQSTRRPIAFDGVLTPDGNLDGFVAAGSHLTHLRIPPVRAAPPGRWSTEWSFLGVSGSSFPFDLYVGTEDGRAAGWFFFRDPRLPGLFGYGAECAGDEVRFREKNLSLDFDGRFNRDRDVLTLTVRGFGGERPIEFRRLDADPMDGRHPGDGARASYREHAPEALDDGWPTARPTAAGLDPALIAALVEAARAGDLPGLHGVLVARRGRLVVEEYFHGFDRDLPHDQRSASKTIAAALVGLAIEGGHLPGDGARVLDYFPTYRRLGNWDPRKARITVRDLLTMSSGLDADDSKRDSKASENSYQGQSGQPDWLRFALDAPMIDDPGATSRYGSANPMLLGGVLAAAAGEPVERFAHRELFAPLGITSYRWFHDPTGAVYLGGGIHLRPRDMLKFGQLHLDGGHWAGRRVLSEKWVRRSMGKHGRLENVEQGNEYGYLWWHHQYRVGERTIASIEARGNGGQYIFVVPELELVAAITSGNYRRRELLRQPEEILELYVLPAVAVD